MNEGGSTKEKLRLLFCPQCTPAHNKDRDFHETPGNHHRINVRHRTQVCSNRNRTFANISFPDAIRHPFVPNSLADGQIDMVERTKNRPRR